MEHVVRYIQKFKKYVYIQFTGKTCAINRNYRNPS